MEPQAPLSDLTVVEPGHSVAAPFVGESRGDLGAGVMKIAGEHVTDILEQKHPT